MTVLSACICFASCFYYVCIPKMFTLLHEGVYNVFPRLMAQCVEVGLLSVTAGLCVY